MIMRVIAMTPEQVNRLPPKERDISMQLVRLSVICLFLRVSHRLAI